MLKKITLKNYMSHAHTVIEPAAGLTVLIGPNNCGKSAVVSALQTLCGNEKGSYMVRHNEKDCRVIVETDDGHTVEWFRSKGVPGYVLDGEPVHRVKKDVLEQIQEVLRLPKVVPSESLDAAERREAFDIHFATQKSPIFLLDEPPSRAAIFFASASDAALLVEMQKKHRVKVQESGREKLRLEQRLRDTDSLLRALDPVAELQAQMHDAQQQYDAIVVAERETAKQRELLAQLETQDVAHARCRDAEALIAKLTPPPALADTTALQQLMEALDHVQCTREEWTGQSAALRTLANPPPLGDAAALRALCENLHDTQQRHAVNDDRAACLTKLGTPPTQSDDAELAQLIAELEAAQRALASVSGKRDALKALETLSDQTDTSALERVLDTWAQLEENAAASKRECAAVEAETGAVLQQIRAWTGDNPTCPTCGAEVDAEALIHREHFHAK